MCRLLTVFGMFFLVFFSCFSEMQIESIGGWCASEVSAVHVEEKIKNNSFPLDISSKSGGEFRRIWGRCRNMLRNGKKYPEFEALVERYPRLVHFEENGRNLLMEAIRQGNEDAAAFLVPRFARAGRLDDQDSNGNTALFTAIQERNKYIAALLLFYGARINVRNREGFDPLQFACTLENFEMFCFTRSVCEKLDELKSLAAEEKLDLTKAVQN